MNRNKIIKSNSSKKELYKSIKDEEDKNNQIFKKVSKFQISKIKSDDEKNDFNYLSKDNNKNSQKLINNVRFKDEQLLQEIRCKSKINSDRSH